MKIEQSTPIELIYKPRDSSEEHVVVRFQNGYQGPAEFDQEKKLLESVMKQVGILIPPQVREQYPEFSNSPHRQAIYLADDSFGKAFYEIYFEQNLNPEEYHWKQI